MKQQLLKIRLQLPDDNTPSSYRYTHNNGILALSETTIHPQAPKTLALTAEQLFICQQGEQAAYYHIQVNESGSWTFHLQLTLDGGTFSPLHNGHQQRLFNVDDFFKNAQGQRTTRLCLLPCGQSGYTDKKTRISNHHKKTMLTTYLEALNAGGRDIALEPYELDQEGPSRTANTLAAIIKRNHGNGIQTHINFVTSDESLSHMAEHWQHLDQLFQQCHLIVCPRADMHPNNTLAKITRPLGLTELSSPDQLFQGSNGYFVLDTPIPPCSSSDIVQRIQRHDLSWKTRVPTTIRHYIEANNLYGYCKR